LISFSHVSACVRSWFVWLFQANAVVASHSPTNQPSVLSWWSQVMLAGVAVFRVTGKKPMSSTAIVAVL